MAAPQVRIRTLRINGQDVSAREDQTILQVAQENDIFIPALCHVQGLSSVGACRLCLIEIAGNQRLLPACTTRVTEGMEGFTDSERLQNYRRMILELLFSERNHICAVCVTNGHCDLQALAQKLGVNHVR